MLHITLDTSIVEIKEAKAVFSCAIAGVEEKLPNLSGDKTPEQFKSYYYPWYWNIGDAKLLWIGKNIIEGQNNTHSEEDIFTVLSTIDLKKIGNDIPKEGSNNKDDDNLKVFYENKLDQMIEKDEGAGIYKLKESYCKANDEKRMEIKDMGKSQSESFSIEEQLKHKFLPTSLAYYAQQLAPLNQKMNLSLFFESSDNFYIPENATHFLIYFPLGDYKDENVENLDISRVLVQNTLLPANDLKFLDIPIELRKELQSIMLHQPVTAIASYQTEDNTDDFIGELKGFPSEGYKSVDVGGKITVNRMPNEIRTGDFTFKGNTTLVVSDVSEIGNLASCLLVEYSYDRILARVLIKMLTDYNFNSIDLKNQFNDAFTSIICYYAKKVIENLLLQNDVLIRNKNLFSDFYKIDPLEIVIFDNELYLIDSDIFSELNVKLSELTAGVVWEENSDKFIESLARIFKIVNGSISELREILFFSQVKPNKEGVENAMLKRAADQFFKSSLDAEDNYSRKLRQDILRLKDKLEIIDIFTDWSDNKISVAEFPELIADLLNIDEEKWKIIKKEIFEDWVEQTEAPENIPPPLNIEVQEINTQTGADLINEISGHIVLSRRSRSKVKSNEEDAFEDWKYLNWAKVSLDNGENFLKGKYLIPAVLPKIDGIQKTSFHLSNESLSLISGHDNQTGDDISDIAMNFNYSFVDEKQKNPVPAAPALWYGHHYEFAGFVALNSGALPEAIRATDKAGHPIWNKPKEMDIKFPQDKYNIAEHHHLRRVPIGLPNVSSDYKNHFPQVPLLVNELIKNNAESVYDNENNKVEQKKITAFLLCEKNGDQKRQDKLTITIDKPYTSFWNWYAYEGNELNNKNGSKTDRFNNALKAELEIRNDGKYEIKDGENIISTFTKNPYLWEPAIENEMIVKIQPIFSINNETDTKEITIAVETAKDSTSIPENLKISIGGTRIEAKNNTITIPPGTICKISIHCKIKKSLFDKEEPMFHSWMQKHIGKDEEIIKETVGGKSIEFYLTNPEVIYIETAVKNNQLNLDKVSFENQLYQCFTPQYHDSNEYGVFCTLNNSANKFKDKFPYFSRCEVSHQVWRWNGRLFSELKDTANLDPTSETPTTEAMKWEAWEFANRPDFTALVNNENIIASFDNKGNANALNQMIFKDPKHKNDSLKAHYFRFGLKMYNRYESIGEDYNEAFQAQNNDAVWKRFLKKMQLADGQHKLPKPSIRFAIPLTDALGVSTADGQVRAASLMIATYDRCFDESGLAERFEVGIEIASSDNSNYLQAGEDPILSAVSIPATLHNMFAGSSDGRKFVTFIPVGPAALTFDMLSQSPKVVGSTFILNVEDIRQFLPDTAKLNAYAMVKIAIRRVLNSEFVSVASTEVDGKTVTPDIRDFYSDWSASEWVQLLPAVDSLIPAEWRKADAVSFTVNGENLEIIGDMPKFDDTFEDCMERYLVVSEKLDDIGEQQVERYVGVYKWNSNESEKSNLVFDPDISKKYKNGRVETELSENFTGYLRLMLVRKTKEDHDDSTDIWEKLFGKKVNDPMTFGTIENDPLAAMPLVSKRIKISRK
jgi:hypothetical protein